MTKNVLSSIFAAARDLLRTPLAVVVLLTLYLALIAACFFFITTREATVWQLAVTFASALFALTRARAGTGLSAWSVGAGVGQAKKSARHTQET